jgi:glyoxylase-like metal-dependent hydrolase (beta-lactamase superfamily II)
MRIRNWATLGGLSLGMLGTGLAVKSFPSYDLFGDGSIMLMPLPGHTAGNTGMFINRSNGPRIFLLGDAAWVAANYQRPATMHPFIWSRVTLMMPLRAKP